MICNGKPSIDDTIQLLYIGLIHFPTHSKNTSCVTKQINCVLCGICSPTEVVVPLSVCK